jgi:hypothetical protein
MQFRTRFVAPLAAAAVFAAPLAHAADAAQVPATTAAVVHQADHSFIAEKIVLTRMEPLTITNATGVGQTYTLTKPGYPPGDAHHEREDRHRAVRHLAGPARHEPPRGHAAGLHADRERRSDRAGGRALDTAPAAAGAHWHRPPGVGDNPRRP